MRLEAEKTRRWILPAMVVGVGVLGLAAYLNTVRCGFVYDDQFAILANEVVTDPDRLSDVFTSSYWGSLASKSSTTGYRPLTILSYHVNYQLARESASSFHAVNAILHALVCSLLTLMVIRVTRRRWVGLFAGAIFALHAVHTEAVASIVGRAELLAALFVVGALLVHDASVRLHDRSRAGWIAAGVGAGVLGFGGLLCKETALALPLLAVCFDWWARRRLVTLIPLYASYVVAIGSFLGLRLALFGAISPASGIQFVDNPMVALSFLERIPASILTFGKAVLLLVLPGQLSSDYAHAQLPLSTPFVSGLFWVGVVSLVGMAVLVWFTWRTERLVPVALALFLFAYAPVSNLVLVIHTVFGERTLYLPSVGICLLLAVVGARYVVDAREKVKIAAIAVLSVYLCFMLVRTYKRNEDWKSDYTLTTADIQVCPNSVRLLNNHGNELMGRGRVAEGCKQLRKAVQIHDGVMTINANLGLCILKLGEVDEAIEIFEAVLEEEPENPVSLKHLPIAKEIREQMKQDDLASTSTP